MAIVIIKELQARRAARAAAAGSRPGSEDAAPPLVADAAPGSAADEADEADGDMPSTASASSVGYGRPPVQHRFRKDDGRPRGPAKGSRRLKSPQSYLTDELAKLVAVRTGERLKRVTTLQALMMMVVERAKKGDARAMRDVLSQAAAALPATTEKILDTVMTETDRATLAAFEARVAARISNSTKPETDDDLS